VDTSRDDLIARFDRRLARLTDLAAANAMERKAVEDERDAMLGEGDEDTGPHRDKLIRLTLEAEEIGRERATVEAKRQPLVDQRAAEAERDRIANDLSTAVAHQVAADKAACDTAAALPADATALIEAVTKALTDFLTKAGNAKAAAVAAHAAGQRLSGARNAAGLHPLPTLADHLDAAVRSLTGDASRQRVLTGGLAGNLGDLAAATMAVVVFGGQAERRRSNIR
jgi:hypothetical protein